MKKNFVKRLLIVIIITLMLTNLIYKDFVVSAAAQSSELSDTVTTANNSGGDTSDAAQIVKIIKNAIAKWYYVMRLIVIAFMLVLLIFIGIKMAISNIASEKSIYKQMLVDWVAGMVIVFSIHYIMIFILNVNDSIVEALRPLATEASIYEKEKEAEYGLESSIKTSSEVETTLYESARTRAYSLKLTDGFTGMIIYGALVYYAWRFALMYFKRLINIIILTLLAPAVSASYAFNKVLTGKAKIFSTWLSEYIMNVVIQIVHVVVYISFVSTALRLSLVSLPGTILALILLSFMLKADKILRQIFKISGGKGSLAGDMADHSGFKETGKEIKGMGEAMLGGELTRKAMGSTYRLATKPVRAAGQLAFGKTMETLANSEKYQNWREKRKEDKVLDAYDKFRDGKASAEELESLKRKQEQLEIEMNKLKKQRKKTKNIKGTNSGIKSLQKKQAEVQKQIQAFEEEEQKLQEEFMKEYLASGTLRGELAGGIAGLFDPKKYTKKGKDGKYHRIKTKREGGADWAFWRKKKSSIGKKFLESAKWNNLLGITDEEKDILKEEAKYLQSSILGVITSIVGFPALGVNPGLGMALLSQAGVSRLNVMTRRRQLKNRAANRKNAAYKFKGFSEGAQATMKKEAMSQIKEAESELTKRNMKKHKKIAMQIMETTKTIVRPIGVAGASVSAVCLGMRIGGGIPGELESKKNGTKFNLVDTTVFEEERLDGLYQKKLREAFKDIKIEMLSEDTKELVEDYNEQFENYEQNLKQKAEGKNEKDLMLNDKLANANAIAIGSTVMEIKTDDGLDDFANKADEIDSSDMSKSEKLSQIKSEINKNKTALIESAITKMCISKGVNDISKLNLSGSEVVEVKKTILGVLEERGIIKKGEIDLSDTLVSNESINSVYDNLSKNSDETNEKIEEKIVESAYLEYMAKENITDVKKLKTDDAKQEIYDIIVSKLMSDSSKKSADVISQLTGENIIKDEFELSEGIKEKVDNTTKKIKKTSTSELIEEANDKGKTKLVERQTNRQSNHMKDKLEEAVYTGDNTNLDGQKQLEMLFLLSEMEKKNVEAKKLGEKSDTKKGDTLNELKYHEQKDGSKRFDQTKDGNQDLTEKLRNIETKIHGPAVDVIDLINKVGK